MTFHNCLNPEMNFSGVCGCVRVRVCVCVCVCVKDLIVLSFDKKILCIQLNWMCNRTAY